MMSGVIDSLQTILSIIHGWIGIVNTYIWDGFLIYLLLFVGVFFTLSTGCVQIRFLLRSWLEMLRGRRSIDGGISSFQAFATGLASRVGSGNIAGVAIAVASGGPGAVFWMWLIALIGMASAFAESSLAQLFKIRHHQDQSFRGGPAYYIQIALGQRWLGIIFALCLVLAYGWVFNALQANSIVASMSMHAGTSFDPNHLKFYVGIFLVLLTCPIIFGGIRRVSRVAEIMVPFMAFIYIILAFAITIININHLPGIISIIFKQAFDTQAAAGGIAGAAFKTMMTLGIKRGLFSNEAGMGSAPNMAATATTSHPVNQGLIQMLGVFFDTMIICTCTALIILMSGVLDDPSNALLKGVQLTQQAVVSQFGYGAGVFLTIAIFFFAFSSIIGNYAYAEANIEFINQNKSFMFVFRILVLLLIFIGSVAELPVVWDAADLSMGLMATINLIVIVILYPYVLLLLKDYINQIKSGVNQPVFRIKNYPQIEKKVTDKSIW